MVAFAFLRIAFDPALRNELLGVREILVEVGHQLV